MIKIVKIVNIFGTTYMFKPSGISSIELNPESDEHNEKISLEIHLKNGNSINITNVYMKSCEVMYAATTSWASYDIFDVDKLAILFNNI